MNATHAEDIWPIVSFDSSIDDVIHFRCNSRNFHDNISLYRSNYGELINIHLFICNYIALYEVKSTDLMPDR